MAAEETKEMQEAYPMKGGNGLYSYTKNSKPQRAATDAAKELIKMAIEENFDKEILFSSKTLRIADLGCSVGPNTFFAVQNIIEAFESRYQKHQELNSRIPEFQVFFSDHTSNDFNLLFTSLPQNNPYYAAGVPGSFYGRLFPKASLHFVYTSVAIHFRSEVPKEVMNKNSLAWNKGRIYYIYSSDEVVRTYKAQFDRDMEKFLQARAEEIVYGGLLVIVVGGIAHETHHSQSHGGMILELLGTCLMDLAKKGIVSEDKVDSFNIPIYLMTPQEVEAAVERNGCFSVERVEDIHHVGSDENNSLSITNAQEFSSYIRSGMEGLIKKHFGEEILDVLFDTYRKKVEDNPSIFKSGKALTFFILLKRKAIN
ncbi:loganic acid O-methyltransferase-like [Ziziphus jujuba]|uniref:Loganic acid O-methyltransferase-like n=1 Tax=Ziziphus jujuba TaxID=326968 RepID=A0ABM3IKA6_ZIZJJ|nr:loganic acid O-methyltransferase-like [Ziziphus jujuba]